MEFAISNSMNLSQLIKNRTYIISQIKDAHEHLVKRYFQLGLVPGAEIILKRKAPIFRDPIIFQVEGAQVVLTKAEASLVEVHDEH